MPRVFYGGRAASQSRLRGRGRGARPAPHEQLRRKAVVSQKGKSHLVIMFTVEADDVAEGDRLFASHEEWMKGHPREGDAALLSYSISKGPELSNPMDPGSDPTGKTIFVLDEVYQSPAGVPRHWEDAVANWADFNAIVEWSGKAEISTLHSGTLVQALW